MIREDNRTPEVNSGTDATRLALILRTGRLRLWLYELSSRHFFWLSEEGAIADENNPTEFSRLYDRDDFERLRSVIFDICDGRTETARVRLRGAATASEALRHYETSVSVMSRDAGGRAATLLGVQHDVTDEVRRQERADQMLMRYHTIFNSSQLDMLFYDRDGVLSDINERACESFNVADRQMVLDGSFLLKNNPMYSDIPLEKMQNTSAGTIVDFDKLDDAKFRLDELHLHGKMFYESAINPIRDEEGRLEGIYMAGRDVSEMVESFHRQQESSRRLREATRSMEEYVSNINYTLRVNDIRLVKYDPKAYTFEISDDVRSPQLRLSQVRCLRLASQRYRHQVGNVLNRMDRLRGGIIEQAVETTLLDKQGRQLWLFFNLVPITGADGRVERYVGLCRDITETVATEQQLECESRNAKDTERVMQAFLKNMSQEIRMPLMSVVEHATRLSTRHELGDETMLVEGIKHSTSALLQLVNDVMLLTRLDAGMQEYRRTEIDVVVVFDAVCQSSLTTRRPGVEAVVRHQYRRLVVSIDEEAMTAVLHRLCSLACSMTQSGSITATYEYRLGQLMLKIEDTGSGISRDLLSHCFERFARADDGEILGTGLDLPIVEIITQQIGGSVDIQSEEGLGTTAWVSLPCEAKEIEKLRTE